MSRLLEAKGYDGHHAVTLREEGIGPEELRSRLAHGSDVGGLGYTHRIHPRASGTPGREADVGPAVCAACGGLPGGRAHSLSSGHPYVASRRASRNPSRSLWRKRQIVLDPEVVASLFAWHGGQFTPTYALASSGMRDLVSLSMIDAAKGELEAALRKSVDAEDLNALIGNLDTVRTFWQEHTAKEAGMGLDEDEYEYDGADYGIDPEREAEIEAELSR